MTHLPPQSGEDILPCQEVEAVVQLFSFDKAYVDRLRDGDSSTEQHFVAYFAQLLRIKLRARMLQPDKVKDLSQETFIRVIAAIRREGGIHHPERLGAFVNSICNNVLHEAQRKEFRNQPMEDAHFEIRDKTADLEGMLDRERSKERVRRILGQMPERDRDLLRAIFLEEKEKDEVCRKFGVDRGYLRVLVHRAKDRFRALYEKDPSATAPQTER
jgi:RNA polymerase sigma-70 factor, ECF subfamily